MYNIEEYRQAIITALLSQIKALGYDEVTASALNLSPVPEIAQGDIALACYSLRDKLSTLEPSQRKNPVAIAAALANALKSSELFDEVLAAGPYVNMSYQHRLLAESCLGQILKEGLDFPIRAAKGEKLVIEFSGPNTNKPQHLGHLRNNVIGEAISRILKKIGAEIVKVNIINDRGIHICKSMLAYMRHGKGQNPQTLKQKGDHFVGDFYVHFEKDFQAEYRDWQTRPEGSAAFEAWKMSPSGLKAQKALDQAQALLQAGKKAKPVPELFQAFVSDYKDKYFNDLSPLGKAATELLLKWEEGDPETLALWKQLNQWVLEGFDETYQSLGIRFDRLYFESETYKLGKDIVYEGLEREVFKRLPDRAIAFDLSKIGLNGEKIVLRSNATSVYITQDIGTAQQRYEDYRYDKMIYVVADQQNHHFKVLFGIMGELYPDLRGRFEHLSYGMVTLPNGRMKSREGTVVDTDELIVEMTALVKNVMQNKEDKEHYQDADAAELERRARVIALAALKYFLLDVTPPSWMEFDPEKSLDLQGRTGAYCLMNYARTRSILRKAGYQERSLPAAKALDKLQSPQERALLIELMQFQTALQWAAEARDPSKLAEYLFKLCKSFAFIFTDKSGHPILGCEDIELKAARLALVDATSLVLKIGLELLGIECLEEM